MRSGDDGTLSAALPAQRLVNLFHLLGDGDVLRAFLFALTAIGAVRRPLFGGGHALVEHEAGLGGLEGEKVVVHGEVMGDIDPPGTGETVAAGGAVDPEQFPVSLGHAIDQGQLFRFERIGNGFMGDPEVLPQLLHGVHPAQHGRNSRVVPDPAQGPLGGRSLAGRGVPKALHFLRDSLGELSSPQRLHDDHPDPPGGCVFQSLPARLVIPVVVVVLDQAEGPVIGIRDLLEGSRIVMEGKSCEADPSLSLHPLQEIERSHLFHLSASSPGRARGGDRSPRNLSPGGEAAPEGSSRNLPSP